MTTQISKLKQETEHIKEKLTSLYNQLKYSNGKSKFKNLNESIKKEIESTKIEFNKKEKEYLSLRDSEEEKELLRRVDSAGVKGYKLESGDIPMLLAAYRLCSNPHGFGNNVGLILVEKEQFTLTRKIK